MGLILCAALLVASGCARDRNATDPAAEPPSAPSAKSVRPWELELAAYQLSDRILVVARGANATGGFDTRFERARDGALVLHNVPPDGLAIQMISPFELDGWMPAKGPRERVTVRIASADEEVPVRAVPRVHEGD